MTAVFVVLRIVAVLAIGAAVVGQIVTSLAFWQSQGLTDIGFRLTNFFSFFTIESNVAATVVLVMAVGLTLMKQSPMWFSVLRAVVTTFMVTTGIVYNLLLRGIELPQGATLEWSNEILHLWGPLYVLADWIFAPGRHRLEWKHIGTIIAFPMVWAVYTLVRGPLTFDSVTGGAWYPYPFLNPDLSANGYLSVAFYVILIAAVIGLTGAGVIRLSRTSVGQRGARSE
ncbi:MAG: Pr6Pr family membrane protein [Microcella sp.]|uniref:Pr6Pr family membrane protein n=1 Tax=Microcella sp. TaxID=1913979 RepID=UPI0024CA5687|nr:Pr6Pr family membrane protein [Microcella sp.]UYN82767.1 MAG: Pr6Pr family membrane protein [Microcella sp.]